MARTFLGTLKLYQRLILVARPYWPSIAAFLLASLCATPLALLAPLPLKIAVDSVLGDEPFPALLQHFVPQAWLASNSAMLGVVAGLIVLFALLLLLQQLAVAMLKTYTGERLMMRFRTQLFRHVQRLSLAFLDRHGTADSTYRIHFDATCIQSLVVESLVPTISAAAMLAGMLYVTAAVSVQLVLVALAVCPVLLAITALFSGKLRTRWREVKKLESSAQSVVQETLAAMRVVKAFNREEHEHSRFVQQYEQGVGARLAVALQENYYTLLVGLTVAAGTALVLFVGVRQVQAGALSLGELLLVMAYLAKLYDPLKTIGKQLASKQRALASAERAFALLDEYPEVIERSNARPLARASGAVRFENVAFEYEADAPVLREVSFDVPAGCRVGIVGRTGAGKTTLLNLLVRLYDPNTGRILLDGVDLRDYKLDDLRNQFSVVLQDPVLFSTTIAENIAYGRPGATDAEIIAAAKAAHAHEFIEALPQGYQTLVGERGMRLSGGERQRISIARAFLKEAPILILDEPTSAVDVETEQAIVRAMEHLMLDRTTFTIAHRTSTLANCDLVLRVIDGSVLCQSVSAVCSDDREAKVRQAVIHGS